MLMLTIGLLLIELTPGYARMNTFLKRKFTSAASGFFFSL